MSIAIGSYVWYTRKNCIVKVLEYDRSSDSYTIESKGKIIDTLARFLDANIGSKCMIFHDEKLELEGKIAELESFVLNLKKRNLAEKQKFEAEKRDIDSYVSTYMFYCQKETKKTVKQSNEDIVRDIIENCESESITMKLIKDELKKRGIELLRDELKAIITKINEDDD